MKKMNILFLTIVDFSSLDERGIYTDVLRKFYQKGHGVYAISPVERRRHRQTECLKIDEKLQIVKLKTGNIQKTGVIEKGISTITLESAFIAAIKKYYVNIKFDLILYTTSFITFQKVVNYVKKRDGSITYLMLKDIFPQNAVDIGVLSKHGIKGLLYRYYRRKEIKLYRNSDYIGCMSEANIKYVRRHNPQIERAKIELCPNCREPIYKRISEEENRNIRKKLGIPRERLLFVYGGNLGKPQGIDFLIECLQAMKSNQNVYFLIVGSGTEYGKLKNFIKTVKPQNVKLLQQLPAEQYENMILAADVGMLFLDHRFTIPNFPSRLLAYMQAGVPVLSVTDRNTDVGDIIEKGKFGWKCLSEDCRDFVNKVDEIVNVDDLSIYGENAWKYLNEHYTADCVYKIILKHM